MHGDSGDKRRGRGIGLTVAVLALLSGAAGADRRAPAGRLRTAAPVRAPIALLYCWDATIPGNDAATSELLDQAERWDLDTLAIEASPVGYGEPGAVERYRAFVNRAHRRGIGVLALGGYPWFTVAPDAGLPDQPTSWLEGWSLYGTIAAARVFDGVLDDSCPAGVEYANADGTTGNSFWDDTGRAAADYLTFLAGLEDAIGDLPHFQAVPAWFDSDPRLASLVLDGETRPHSLAWYTARHADVLNVLAYRDRADEILALSEGELALGPVVIGVETMDLGIALDPVTFFEEGVRGLRHELSEVWDRARHDPNFRGISVHHAGSLRVLETREPRRRRN